MAGSRTLLHRMDIGQDGILNPGPHQRTLSGTVDFNHKGLQKSASCWRTLCRAADFDHDGSQESAPLQRILSRASDLNHGGSQKSAPHQRTLSCAADFNHDGPQGSAPRLVGGLYLTQPTLTTNGLKDLLLFRGLCLTMQTLSIMTINDTHQPSMTNDTFCWRWKTEKPQIEIQLTRTHGKVQIRMLITLHLIIYLEDFALCGHWSIATMVKQAVACRRRLEQNTMEPKMLRVDLPWALSGFEKNLSERLTMQKSSIDPMLWKDGEIYGQL